MRESRAAADARASRAAAPPTGDRVAPVLSGAKVKPRTLPVTTKATLRVTSTEPPT